MRTFGKILAGQQIKQAAEYGKCGPSDCPESGAMLSVSGTRTCDFMRNIEQPPIPHRSVPAPFIAHEIDGDHYHELDDYGLDHDPAFDGLYQADNVVLVSVGIDIGSS